MCVCVCFSIHRLTFSDMPLKAMPVLEVDGKKLCQGAAIARYLARVFGKYSTRDVHRFLEEF